MKKLKRMISRYMQIVTLIIVGVILIIAVAVLLLNEQKQARNRAESMFVQIEQLLEENQNDLTVVTREYSMMCLKRAEAIAYIIENDPLVLESIEELKRIANMVQVDEIHIFDKEGRIFTGTHPEYYEMTMDSGEQIGFFKPMLLDKDLRLCQQITENTAEGKLMQYSAMWSNNQKFIVQIGMKPVNVMRNAEKSQLSYVFSLLRVDVGVNFYAINQKSEEIVGATISEDVGKDAKEVGFDLEKLEKSDNVKHLPINGVNSFCVFTQVGDNLIGRVISNDVLYQTVPVTLAGLAFCLLVIAIFLVNAVTWYMNRYVIKGIHNVNDKLRTIAKGNLDENVDVQSSQEFSELSSHINEMVESILGNTQKISYVLNKTDMHIGVYEYNEHMKNVRFTEQVPKILALNPEQVQSLSADYVLFKEYIQKLQERRVPGEEGIYQLDEDIDIYVKIEEVAQNHEVFGVVMDVSEEVIRRKQIEAERDIDSLTGLYNRRGMENQLEHLFAHPEKLGFGALIMIDADGLKGINDKYGHEKGDVYLKKIAEALENFGLKSRVAARQGGDEFVLFLYDYESEEQLMDAIDALEYIQNHSIAQLDKNLEVPLSFSFGVSQVWGSMDYLALLKQADKKMYANKRARKEAAAKVEGS